MIDVDPVVALDKVFELAGRLGELMHRTLAERGLTPARAQVLLVLHEGGPVVQRQLSQALRCTPRHITTLVDDLEAEALVTRQPHPTDRRATLVLLTERGAEAAATMAAERQGAARDLLGDVSAADLAAFVAVADQVLDRIDAACSPDVARGLASAGADMRGEAPRQERLGGAGRQPAPPGPARRGEPEGNRRTNDGRQ